MSLSTRDRVTAKAVISALLEEENTEFTEGVQNVFGIMGHRIGARLVALITQGGHASWKALATQVASELAAELNESCPVCLEPLYERVALQGTDTRLLGHPKNCCGRMYHRRCVAEWVTSKHRRGQEATCIINRNVTLSRDLFPVQDQEQHVFYLQQQAEEHTARRRTSFTEEERAFLSDDMNSLDEQRDRDLRRVAELWSLDRKSFV